MPHTLAIVQYNEWAALGILFLLAAGFAIFNVVLSTSLGPKRRGKTKETPYESGVNPIGDTHQRFNVRFYLVAMIFLVFDVEVLFLIPWLTIFPKHAFDTILHLSGTGIMYGTLFASVLTFSAIILVAYFYAWGKGVLKWD
jgi:NADH-quinone oxidoreductase subunit A